MAIESRFLKACRREATDATPIWLMRQAGRYMPEYRHVREHHPLLTIIKTPELACDVTLQPIKAFDLDAAIIFADILPPLEGMGLHLRFAEGEGPVIGNPVRTVDDIARLRVLPPEETLPFTLDAIRLTRAQLNGRNIPLIGFSGAPFTLAAYAIEGRGSRHYTLAKGLMMSAPDAWNNLMTKLSEVVGAYLLAQARAGAQALQIFDSWAGQLSASDYRQFALPYTQRAIAIARAAGVPIIHFATDTSGYLETMRETGADVVSVDWRVDLRTAWQRLGEDVAVQGNLDPVALLAPWGALEQRTQVILDQAGGRATSSTWATASCLRPLPTTSSDWWTSCMNIRRRAMDDGIIEYDQPAQSLPGGRVGGLRGEQGEPLGAALAASAPSAHVIILGGGITGLSAAWHLQQAAARDSLPITYTLIEQSDRWGGKVRSEVIERDGAPAWVLEAGPDGLLTRKPWALALARDLRLDEHFLFVNRENSRTFVLHRGRPEPLPAGLQLLAPTQWRPFLRSPLFSPWGKVRIALDMLVPPRRTTDDESLAAFVRRRFGDEALQRLAEPMLAGVYNAEPERQSILATFPQFPALERTHGSVIRGLRAASRQQPPAETPAFLSFDAGNQTLVDALVAGLTGDLRLNTTICGIAQADDSGYELRLDDDTTLAADAVILATPANVAATLTRETAPGAAALLAGIRYAGIGAIYLAYRRNDIPHPLNGTGVVIPPTEGRRIDGITWVSSKWDHRAPPGHALVRVFFGGPHTRAMLDLDDAKLTTIVCEELADILGVRAEPLFTRIFRWPDGYPQYDVGHLERVAAVEAGLPPGMVVACSSYRGVGVPDCIHQGQLAAANVVETLKNRQTAARRLPV